MHKYIFLLPLYNDWESLQLVLAKISEQMVILKCKAEILVINDFSSVKPDKFKNFKNLNKIKILNLSKNVGSQKAISIGLSHLKNLEEKSIITVLDSDGEDDVTKIPVMIKAAEDNERKVIVSTRSRRQENVIFKIAYFFHKLITLLFTLKWISFGNYSSFNSKQLDKILINNYSWLALSSCLAKNCELVRINAERKKRLTGISKLSVFGLVSHSLRVMAVFLPRVLLLSLIFVLILSQLLSFETNLVLPLISLIIFFNLSLIFTYILNNQKDFLDSENLIEKIENF